jgi:hypothetical protein
MNRRAQVRWTVLAAIVAMAVAGAGWFSDAVHAQRKPAAAAKQETDADYTAKIREYTTEPFFLTELVDHLPASDKVPSPQKTLGYVVGTPGKLTYTKDLYKYYRALAAASPRVKVWSVGKSEEGREFLMVAVTSEENMARLDRLKQITASLADPRHISDADAQKLVAEGVPFYWLSGSIHSPETGSPEMLMELAYRLAVEDSPLIQSIRRNAVVLITPVLEVDGRDRMVDLYNYRLANPGKAAPGLLYWGKYVAHDNNRDGIGMALQLSKVQMKNFLDWHPQVLHDLHESVPYLYTSTGTGPYNAWLDPIVISEWQSLAYHEIEEMTRRGVPGVWTHGFYDGWAPNYMFYVANGHNSIGRFYETFGNGGADTKERTLPAGDTSRTWYRPNPPLTKVKWSIRNNVNLQQSALLFAMQYVADHRDEFLNNFYLKSKRSVAKATTEGPAAWVILNDGKRPALAASLARLLQQQGSEVHRIDQEFEPAPPPKAADVKTAAKPAAADANKKDDVKKPDDGKKAEEAKPVKIPAGSYVIRMDQPYSRMADMLLDTQYYSTADPRPYDDTGWTMGPLRNVPTLRVTDAAILKAPMTLVKEPARASGSLDGPAAPKFYLVNASAEPALATLRYRLKGAKFFAAEDAFTAGGASFNAGSFLIPAEGNPSNLRESLESAAADLGLRVHASDEDVKVARHPVALPRIAVMHTWINTQNEGWYRLMLDEAQVPYAYISDHTVAATPNLKEKYDVIIFPPVTGDVARLIRGLPRRLLPDGSDAGGPIPWKNSSLTPNMGGIGDPDGPDQADDIRGGIGYEGLANLNKFIEDGGLFIPVGASANLPISAGLIDGVSVAEAHQLQARGGVYNANVEDKHSPIAYGYDDKLALYFNQSPVLKVSLGGGFGGFDFGGPARPSGRGAVSEPDIPQGRPWNPPTPEPKRSKAEQELYVDPEVREFLRGVLPPPQMYPRVVLRFAEEKDLWVSGMLAGGSDLAQTPAVVDVPVGRGHVVLFASNPMWRHQTQGQFMLVMNAALNFDHLDAGRVQSKEGEAAGN